MDRQQLNVALEELERVTASGTWVVRLLDPPEVWWSTGTRQLLDWPKEKPAPTLTDALALYEPNSRVILASAIDSLKNGGPPFALDLELRTAAGHQFHVHVSGSQRLAEDGTPQLAGTIQNIDKRKRAEIRAQELGVRLAEFEERWRLATEGSGLGVWDWNTQTNEVFFSSRWKSMLGYQDREVGNQLDEWDRRIHSDDKAQVYADLNAHLEGRTPFYSNEHRVLCKDGRYKWILDRGQVMSRSSDGKALRVVGTHTDIDKQKFLEDVAGQVSTRYQGIFNSTYQFIGLLTPDGTLLEANETALAFAGITTKDVVGKPFWECRWWQTDTATQDQLQDAIRRAAQGETVQYRVRVRGAGDSTAIINFSLKPVRDETGDVVLIVPEGHDVTQQVMAQQALEERDRLFRATFDEAPIGTAIVSLTGRWLEVNAALCDILGYDKSTLLDTTFQEITHPDDLALDLDNVEALLRGDRSHYRMEKRYIHAQGQVICAQLDVTLVRDANNTAVCFLSQIQDITQTRQTELALKQEKELAQTTLASIGDGVIRTDLWGRISFINEAALRLLKCLAGDAIGQPLEEVISLVSERDGQLLDSPVRRVLREGLPTSIPAMVALRRRDGSLVSVEDSCAPLRDTQGQLIGAVFVFHDVSAARELALQLHYQASHDALTGLPNRREFEIELDGIRMQASSRGGSHYLLLLDLDHFKRINDQCGHQAGDTVLRDLASRMRSQLRASDLLARLGGDEFAVILRDCPATEAHRIAKQLIQNVRGYVFTNKEQSFPLGLSIGLTPVVPGLASAAVMNRADSACYMAKDRGRNRWAEFGVDQ